MSTNQTGGSNTACGYEALELNTGDGNSAFGNDALRSNSSGEKNTALGNEALENNTTANHSTAVGHHALTTNTTGTQNVAVGSECLQDCSTGSNNTAVGTYTMRSLTTGSHNCALGLQALYGLSTGVDNVAMGKQAGQDITTGDNNICFGLDAGRAGSPGGAITTGDNNIILGNNSHSYLAARISLSVTSDKRDKTDIKDFTHGLSWIKKLRPVTYHWDQRSAYSDDLSVAPDGTHKESKLNIGLIAQEELEVEKEHGYGNDKDSMLITDLSEDGNHFSMKYERLVPILINAVKELSAEVEQLKSQLNN